MISITIITVVKNNSEEILNADLVVDATGRNSKSPAWLANLGYEKPEEEVSRNFNYLKKIFLEI